MRVLPDNVMGQLGRTEKLAQSGKWSEITS